MSEPDACDGARLVGLVANPVAGTDLRRLVAPSGHVSNAARVATLERVVVSAVECGAERVLVADDAAALGARAVEAGRRAIGARAELLEGTRSGSRLDTIDAVQRLWKAGCAAVVVLGGDGTCRDAAVAWPRLPLIALSTGTNNVFPEALDAVAAGAAAGLVATGRVPLANVGRPSKRLVALVEADRDRLDATEPELVEHVALVDIAVLEGDVIGARAVTDPTVVRAVIAAVARPSASGLSSIAGRIAPLDDDDPDGVVVRLGGSGRDVRVSLVPGRFATVRVADARRLVRGGVERVTGPCVVAFDGERDVVLRPGETMTVAIDDGGPVRIDVGRVLRLGAQRRAFDVGEVERRPIDAKEQPDGD